MATKTSTKITDRTKDMLSTRKIFIRGNRPGVIPMERRLEDGTRNVSSCEYTAQGKMVNPRVVRPIRLGEDQVEFIDPKNPDDVAHLAEVEAWLATEPLDPRAVEFGIEIDRNEGRTSAPIPRYDKYKVDALIARITDELNLIGDDDAAARGFLEQCAAYELDRKSPRKMILEAIDDLGETVGVEYGTDEVVEE